MNMTILLGFIAFVVIMGFASLMEWRAYRKKKHDGRNRSIEGKHRGDHKRRRRKGSR
jgi:hypothetical protein